MRTSHLTLAALTALAVATAPARAAEPAWWTQQKARCGLPPSLAYNTWARQGYPCAGQAQPVQQDPRATLHNRLSAVISANPDLIDGSALGRTNLWDDNALEHLIAGVHRDLWRAWSGFDAIAIDRRWVMGYYRPYLERLESFASSLNAARADLAPQSVVDARDRARAAESSAQAALDSVEQQVVNESLGVVFSATFWEGERNKTLALLRARAPKGATLPHATNENGAGDAVSRLHIPHGPFNVLPDMAEPAALTMAAGLMAPAWNPDGLVYRHATPRAEPPMPGDFNEQVSELERMAGEARAAKARAEAAGSELAQMADRYRSYAGIAEKGQGGAAQIESEANLSRDRATWLATVRRNALARLRNETWRRVYATSKGLVWQAMEQRVVPQALRDIAHSSPVEKARKYQALVAQVRGLESDFELFSPQAARVLAQGSPEETQHILDAVWGVSKADGLETMQKALDAADAPASLGRAWRKIIGAAP